MVIGVTDTSNFNYEELTNEIISNNWHIVVSGTFWDKKFQIPVKSLMNLYGICPTTLSEISSWYIDGNICQNITTDLQIPC